MATLSDQMQYADMPVNPVMGDDGELAVRIMDQYRDAANNRRAQATAMQVTLAFLNGNQWVKGNISKGVVPVKNSLNEHRVTRNIMFDAFRWRQSQLGQEQPVPVAIEGGMDVADAEAALVSSRLMRYWYDQCGLKQAMEDAGAWTDTGGISYIVPSWRKSVTRRVKRKVVLDEPRKVLSKNGLTLLSFVDDSSEMVKTGDLAFDTYSSLQVHPLPCSADSWTKVNAVIIADTMSKPELGRMLKHYKVEMPDNPEEMSEVTLNEQILRNINANVGGIFGTNTIDTKECLYLVLTYLERPCEEYPDGRYVMVAGGKVVYDDVLPYVNEAREVDPNDVRNLTMGIIPMFATRFPGKLIPPSIASAMIQPQIELNRALTDQKQNRMAVGRNRIIVRQDALRQPFTDEHGQIIEFTGSDKPEYLPAQTLPGIENEIGMWKEATDAAGGRPAVLQGENLPQVRSSWHMAQIRQAAQWSLNEGAYEREKALTNLMQLCTAIGRREYSFQRMAEIYGEENLGDIPAFFRANLRVDIVIQKGSLVPRNHAEYEAKILELYQHGMFVKEEFSQNDNDKALKMLGMGSMNIGLDGKELQVKRIRRENAAMQAGELFGIFDHDDDNLHIKVHMDFMQTVDFQRLPPNAQQVFWAHTSLHGDRLARIVTPPAPNIAPPENQQEVMA